MRTLASALLVSCLLLSGCEWLQNKRPRPTNPEIQTQRQTPTAAALVAYLNNEADRLSVIESNEVSLTAHVQKQRLPGLKGFMVCEKPRSFRLTADALSTQYVDIGSNGNQFWFWVKDGDAPLYHCSYAEYEKGVKLPLPFQPEWVVQALGMARYDPAKEYRVEVKGNTYELVEETTVQGIPVHKVTVFATGKLDKNAPRVTAHIIADARSGKVICQATIRRVYTANFRTPAGESSVSYPSDILLEWPAEQLSMTMKIGEATVNQKIADDAANRYFSLPNWPNIKTIDLAKMRPTGSPTSQIRPVGAIQ